MLANLQRTCQEAAQSGCRVEMVELTPEAVMALAGSQYCQVSTVAIYTLGQMGDPQACPALERTARSNNVTLSVTSREAVVRLAETGRTFNNSL
ncbi:MAG: hypothetical protein KJ921_01740 [Proteobacteria bacterium]|nr:hypothetical protein [Pseudomonadota bacterium]